MGSSAAWSFRSRVVVGYLLRSTLEKRVSPAVTIDGLRERNSLPELLCMVRYRSECMNKTISKYDNIKQIQRLPDNAFWKLNLTRNASE
ncbi:hypothetical protein ZEAMMB73_Zm00001d032176 [Zea mays]|uniref:Uncharacterized protein n=1 Tax=Zea mays TaxID=4577 RepID=A0A1D6KNY7_MAIZE|nr:hypothetical protein ZEAMMB73_Zm00001d032176 [Zea mays]